jgi:site-specific DNA recombinase
MIHFVKEGAIVSPDSRSSDKFMHGIKVLMAKNYVDNLSEEVRKGLREKAEQGHWPSVAPVGYVNNLSTHRIEVDPVRGPLLTRIFGLYATETYSLMALTAKAREMGLTHPRSGRPMMKAEVHRILQNPIYHGEFVWLAKRYQGSHEALITRDRFDQVQAALRRKHRAHYPKQRHAFMGLLTCARCGCAMTAEKKKGKYVYYRCTGFKGKCGNTYIREERLADLLGNVIRPIQITTEIAAGIAKHLCSTDDEVEQRRAGSLRQLDQRRKATATKLDRGYDDLVSGRISEAFWKRKSQEWESELQATEVERTRLEAPRPHATATAEKILELAKRAEFLYKSQNPAEQRRLLETVLSNCTFDRGSLVPTYSKPFDLLVRGNETGCWRGRRDSNPRPPA